LREKPDRLGQKAEKKLAADKHRSTPIENNELGFVLSAFIGVHRRSSAAGLPFSAPC
jgi:hypothetical protein